MHSGNLDVQVGNVRQRHFRATRYERFVKPCIDRGLSAVLLILLSPALLLIAIAIRFDSPGPVIFVQERVGRHGGRFRVIRFRTLDAQSMLWQKSLRLEPVSLSAASPEVTRAGRFLLSSRLDRLPMLVNVLRGEMSLVGPRAALPYELEHYAPVDWIRLRVKPGVVCLWQLSGLPESDFRSAMALDQEYFSHMSLKLDLRIVSRTVAAVAFGKGKH